MLHVYKPKQDELNYLFGDEINKTAGFLGEAQIAWFDRNNKYIPVPDWKKRVERSLKRFLIEEFDGEYDIHIILSPRKK